MPHRPPPPPPPPCACSLVVWAIAEGRNAAAAADAYLAGKPGKHPEGTDRTQGCVLPYTEFQATQSLLLASA